MYLTVLLLSLIPKKVRIFFLYRIFEECKSGFYVDIGAHHPKRFSNTYFFYKRGWSGITVEPNSDAIKLFKEIPIK